MEKLTTLIMQEFKLHVTKIATLRKKEKLLTIHICYEVTPRAWATTTNKGPSSKEYCNETWC